jgi:uncharacterized lipoprotein NlpE involved in copper resistance
MKSTLFVFVLILLIQSCQNNEATDTDAPDSSNTALDWPGVYTGVLPCTDCRGIETTLTIYQNLTYVLQTAYLGKSDEVLTENGTFTWNSEGNKIQLVGTESGPAQFLVGENGLFQLNKDGKKMSGDLSEKYLLTKTTATTLGFYRWRLTQLMGTYLENGSIAGLRFNAEDQTVKGYGWCNTFSAEFQLQDNNLLRFGKISSTPRTCPDSTAETQFLNMLRVVDAYHIKGRELTLGIGNAPPMAVLQGTFTR